MAKVVKKQSGKKATKKASKKTKKVTKSKAKASATSKRSSKKKQTVPDLDRFFEGKKIALAGRFSWPTKSSVEDFFRSRKGKLTTKVDKDLDILFVGSGRKTKLQTAAEKLNAAGEALIEIFDRLQDLIVVPNEDVPGYLKDPILLSGLENLSDENSFYCDWSQDGIDFSGATIGPVEGENSLEICFEDCCFDKAKFRNIRLGRYDDAFINCTFQGTQFSSAVLKGLKNSELENVKGDLLELYYPVATSVKGMAVKELVVNNAYQCQFSDLKVGKFSGTSIGDHKLTESDFESCKFGAFESESPVFEKSTFNKVEFGQIRVEKTWLAVKCKFKDCKFKSAEVESLGFVDCELENCSFEGFESKVINFGGSKIKNCKFSKPAISILCATSAQLSQFIGVDKKARVFSKESHPKLDELAKTLDQTERYSISLNGTYDQKKIVELQCEKEYRIKYSFVDPKYSKKHVGEREVKEIDRWFKQTEYGEIFSGLIWLFAASKITDLNLGSLKVKCSKCPLKSKAMKELIIATFYECMGDTPKSEAEIKAAQKEADQKSTATKKAVKAELAAGNVKSLNKRPHSELLLASPLRKSKFSGVDLSKAKLDGMDFRGSDFSGANLSKAQLKNADLMKANFTGANLEGANLIGAELREVNFTNANLTGAKISNVTLYQAKMDGANLTNAVLGTSSRNYSFLDVVDFSKATMKGTKLDHCTYSEKTRFPKSLTDAQKKKLNWQGQGLPPEERQNKKKPAGGKLDFNQFVERLKETTDLSRLKKSLKMLKADSFDLFCEVEDDHVVGVVKSQSDSKLVYSCTLNSMGDFACCTQNLNACGGLRGAICKHILVLVLGLAKSGDLDPTVVDDWVNDSKLRSPELDKDRMGEVLLKYKGAEAGEIDWRPTETVPEDFLAF